MGDYDFRPEEMINAREIYLPPKRSLEPPIDEAVSNIVGRKVYAQDPRLLKLVLKWKGNKKGDDKTPDNFMFNQAFINDLKATFL